MGICGTTVTPRQSVCAVITSLDFQKNSQNDTITYGARMGRRTGGDRVIVFSRGFIGRH